MENRDKLTEHYEPLLQGTYDSVDRLVLNAYCPLLLNPGGLRYWYRLLYGEDDTLSTARLMRFAGRSKRRIEAFCKKEQIPLLSFKQFWLYLFNQKGMPLKTLVRKCNKLVGIIILQGWRLMI